MVSITPLGKNITQVQLCGVMIWFSYDTVVAFAVSGKRYVSENYWSRTTGKHLTQIDGGSRQAKKERLKSDAFEEAWAEHVEPLFASIQMGTASGGELLGSGFEEMRSRVRRRGIGKLKSDG